MRKIGFYSFFSLIRIRLKASNISNFVNYYVFYNLFYNLIINNNE